MEKSLHLLFTSRDVSFVKSYVQRQCMKILEERASVQDFILAKEYRGRGGYRPGSCVPALELAKYIMCRSLHSSNHVNTIWLDLLLWVHIKAICPIPVHSYNSFVHSCNSFVHSYNSFVHLST